MLSSICGFDDRISKHPKERVICVGFVYVFIVGMFLFWGYTWIVSHLHYDIHLDDDTESYEGELL